MTEQEVEGGVPVEESEGMEGEGGGGGGGSPVEGLREVFAILQSAFQEETSTREKIREIVRDLEQVVREIFTTLQDIHHCPTAEVPALCGKLRGMFVSVQGHFSSLKSVFPPTNYYRYHDHWKFALQRVTFLSCMLVYLEEGKLATREEVAELIGVCVRPENGFHIDLDDFLMGVLSVANELSRLAVNSVTMGDYQRPFAISTFLSDLSAGFRLLNLKNDGLRRRFDSLKYDLKKVEEVVYDISIRGLKPEQ